jgi:predicted Zn-dependent protease
MRTLSLGLSRARFDALKILTRAYRALAVLAMLVLAPAIQTAWAQQPAIQQLSAIAPKYCRGPIVSGSDARWKKIISVVNSLRPSLKRQFPNELVGIFLVESSEINAWTIAPPGVRASIICFPTIMTVFFGGNEDEIAFILGHEIGHAVDEKCKEALAGKPRPALQQLCESRADAIGFTLIVEAGYQPYAAAGSFGRLEMYRGDAEGGVLARFRNLFSNHPITPDRINHMRKILIEYEKQRSR